VPPPHVLSTHKGDASKRANVEWRALAAALRGFPLPATERQRAKANGPRPGCQGSSPCPQYRKCRRPPGRRPSTRRGTTLCGRASVSSSSAGSSLLFSPDEGEGQRRGAGASADPRHLACRIPRRLETVAVHELALEELEGEECAERLRVARAAGQRVVDEPPHSLFAELGARERSRLEQDA